MARVGPGSEQRGHGTIQGHDSKELTKMGCDLPIDRCVELTLREVLGIAKKEFHDGIIDLVKGKRLAT